MQGWKFETLQDVNCFSLKWRCICSDSLAQSHFGSRYAKQWIVYISIDLNFSDEWDRTLLGKCPDEIKTRWWCWLLGRAYRHNLGYAVKARAKLYILIGYFILLCAQHSSCTVHVNSVPLTLSLALLRVHHPLWKLSNKMLIVLERKRPIVIIPQWMNLF